MSELSCHSTSDVIEFAIQKEERTIEFYRKCAERAKNPGLKQFFEEMADEEKNHLDMLRGLDLQALDEIKLQEIEDLKISDYLLDVSFDEGMSYPDALTLAMKKEQKALAFYSAWKNRCIDQKASRLFEILENQEAKHKRKLEVLYDKEILIWD